MNKPHAINDKQTMALEILLQQFPFCQSARALHLKGLYNQESFRYNYELKKTAAHTHDRSILFDFITSQQFATLQKNHVENQEALIHNITVTDSFVVTPIQKETVEKTKEETLEIIEEKTEEKVVCEDGVKDFLHGYGIADSCQIFEWKFWLANTVQTQRDIACHKMDGGYEFFES